MKSWKRYIGLLVFVIGLSYREVQILIDRGSWKKEDYWLPLWYINWKSFWKNWDSFHAIHGLAILGLMEFLVGSLPTYDFSWVPGWLNYQIYVVAYWLVFFQIRNLFMWLFKRKK